MQSTNSLCRTHVWWSEHISRSLHTTLYFQPHFWKNGIKYETEMWCWSVYHLSYISWPARPCRSDDEVWSLLEKSVTETKGETAKLERNEQLTFLLQHTRNKKGAVCCRDIFNSCDSVWVFFLSRPLSLLFSPLVTPAQCNFSFSNFPLPCSCFLICPNPQKQTVHL